MSENGVFDKTYGADAPKSEDAAAENRLTIDSILREYDAKKSVADKKSSEEEKKPETSAFMREIEALDGGNAKAEPPEESFDEADYDDSDMKIVGKRSHHWRLLK